MTYDQWRILYAEAAAQLDKIIVIDADSTPTADSASETRVQQEIRLSLARQGHLTWRNNVGATPSKCDECGAPSRPVRYGIANDSKELNDKFKSSDLLLGIKKTIEPKDVGRMILMLGFAECKPTGWVLKGGGRGREVAQANWINFINKNGGFARFASGPFTLNGGDI